MKTFSLNFIVNLLLLPFLYIMYFTDSLDHQRGRIITHSGQNSSNLVKQEHCVDVVGELFKYKNK
jgi:hypothetical protein